MLNENKLDKIRKLLEKAEDPACTPAEAEALTAKATEWIARYGIEAAMLAGTGPRHDGIGKREIQLLNPYARDKFHLLNCVGEPLRCRVLSQQIPRGYLGWLVGHESDLDRSELLFTSLLVQGAAALAVTSVPWQENATSFRKSWWTGFGVAIARRLREAESKARGAYEQSTGTSTALVVVDREKAVDRAVDEFFPVRRTSSRVVHGSGQRAGYVAGQKADLGARNVSGADRAALG